MPTEEHVQDSEDAYQRHLSRYPTVTLGLGVPGDLDIPAKYWSPDPVEGRRGYCTVCCARGLWDQLAAYDWVLIYQHDAIIFEDRLADFMALPYDYYGAPHADQARYPNGGNGGFSLRRIDALRQALDGWAQWPDTAAFFRHVYMNEDIFWSGHADITPCPNELSYQFAWETDPAWWWLANGRKLPLGAHRWYFWGPEFWANLGGVRTLAGLPEPGRIG